VILFIGITGAFIMKITKQYLSQVIKEELEKIEEAEADQRTKNLALATCINLLKDPQVVQKVDSRRRNDVSLYIRVLESLITQ
jgi:hypothetical protein